MFSDQNTPVEMSRMCLCLIRVLYFVGENVCLVLSYLIWRSLVQDGIHALEKASVGSTPSLRHV